MAAGAKEVLNDIIQDIKESNLNFSMNITPFSAYITLRSSFTKNFVPPVNSKNSASTDKNQRAENHALTEENAELLDKVEILVENNMSSTAKIKVLEEKISKSEASASKSCEEKRQEIISLKLSLKNKDSELANLQKEIKLCNKALKEKEKEEYRLGQKIDNLSESFSKCKSENSTLKAENRKLLKKKPLKSTKSVNVSTNTSPESVYNCTCQFSSTTPSSALDSSSSSPVSMTKTSTSYSTSQMASICPNQTLLFTKDSLACPPMDNISSSMSSWNMSVRNNNNTYISTYVSTTSALDNLTWPPLVAIPITPAPTTTAAVNNNTIPVVSLEKRGCNNPVSIPSKLAEEQMEICTSSTLDPTTLQNINLCSTLDPSIRLDSTTSTLGLDR